ncbi:hypothetical protein HPC49_24620 [Pyxidicoccus fallax]|uniref:Uncharacterized protein n=1 Tax=Pyxidicoccus fallax TaxID=394095 RepID=A0A848LLU0_9BACT|nr:hypothetical protein [Pyxidicoccus fallax]NMO18706.1 hypothetical protein [Pyxidicoccus fallax]NPC81402.1 hypothetical protein [Pyxidicoccus fallax]
MKAILVSLFLLGAAPDGNAPALPPEALAAPPVADDSPTAWACTIDTLRAGKECVFEADLSSGGPSESQDTANKKTLQEAARALCSEAVGNIREGRPDATLTTLCERRFTTAVDQCGLDGTASVIDAKGRFAPGARACYRALSSVLQEVQLMATVASPCCECAARAGCPGTGDRCYADVSQQASSPAALACMNDRCSDACSIVLPSASSGSRSAPSARERNTSSASSGSASL